MHDKLVGKDPVWGTPSHKLQDQSMYVYVMPVVVANATIPPAFVPTAISTGSSSEPRPATIDAVDLRASKYSMQYICLCCGAQMIGQNCKLICVRCGYRETCSDLGLW